MRAIYEELGERLRRARKEAGLTQAEVARRVGLKRTSITNVERGNQHIALHMVYRLADAVGVEPHALLPERAPASSSSEELLKVLSPWKDDETKRWLQSVAASGGSDRGEEDGQESGE